jgi:hypothetical protein
MRSGTKKLIALSIAAVVALMLFAFGLSYPLIPFRVSGDANTYLEIADGFTNFSDVLAFAGDRTVGFPSFEFMVGEIVSTFTSNELAWVNAISATLLVIHFSTAWFFSRWARSTNLIQTENMALVLFVFLATYPALIGHTTSPVTDTFAVDLVVCALMSMHAALTASNAYKSYLWAGLSAFFFGFSILARPGNQLSVATALMAGMALSLLAARRKTSVICVTALGCALVVAPFYYNCAQKYGSICLQSSKYEDLVQSAQAGLRGARTLWEMKSLSPGQWAPILPDDTMFSNYYQRCRLKTIFGTDESSLTGCLITRPLALPAYTLKKWIGLFDHFRFTPYLEVTTPFWLRWLSRAYDSLAWVGLSMFFMTLFLATKRAYRSAIKEKLTTPISPMILVVYSVVMLLQHTALHIEDRFGFPVIPLCAVMLAIYGENFIQSYRTFGYKRVVPLALYCITAWAVFIAQIIIWDNKLYY